MKLRTLAKILAALVALFLVILVAAPLFISADYLKTQLVAQVKHATGRDLTIQGHASLTLFPNIAVKAEDVTLGNPPGFSTPYFVHIATLQTGAALKPLFHQQLEITGLTLEGAEINLEENAKGTKNWEFPVEKAKQETKENLKKDARSSAPRNDFKLGDVSLKDSQVTYRKPGEKPLAAKNIAFTVTGADGRGALKIKGTLLYQNETVSLDLMADKFMAALEGKPTLLSVDLAVASAKLAFKGEASLKDVPVAQGNATMVVDDLPAAMRWATGKPASSGLPKKIILGTKLGLKGTQSATLGDVSLAVDDTKAKGQLAVNLAGEVPAVTGTLNVESIDLDTLGGNPAGSASVTDKPVPSPNKTEGWSTAPITLSGLRAVNMALDLTIDALHVANLDIEDVKGHASLTNGSVKIAVAQAALYSGTAKGSVALNASSASPEIGTDLTLSRVNIESLMTALSGKSRLAGMATLTLGLHGHGTSEAAIVNSLSGNGSVKIADGAIKGVNIAQFFRDAKKGFLFTSASQSTDFTELTASYTVAQGILTNPDLAMKSPVLRVAGSGTVNLPQRSLNYRLVPTLVATLKGQGGQEMGSGLAIPLLITGPWSNPSVTPDMAGMIQEGLKNPQALKQNLKDLKGTLKQFNSPKDLGKALLGGNEAAPTAAPASADPASAPATQPTKQDKINQGIGGLLNALQKKN